MNADLKNALAQVYQVFSGYQPLYLDEAFTTEAYLMAWKAELFSAPLPQLSAQSLSRFAGKTMTTWGRVEDFKHFLPRLTELFADYDYPYDIQTYFYKFDHGEWLTWPLEEQEAIRRVWRLVFNCWLTGADAPYSYEHGDYFHGLYLALGHSTANLDAWAPFSSAARTRRLAEYLVSEAGELFQRNKVGRYAEKADHLVEIRKWLLQPVIHQGLEKAFFRLQEEGNSFDELPDLISEAEQILRTEIEFNRINNIPL